MADVLAGYPPNKYPGACFYCARRVRAQEGATWKGVEDSRFSVAHSACLIKAVGEGRPPERSGAGSTPAKVIRQVRALLRDVTVDQPEERLASVVAQLRDLVVGVDTDAVPF